MKARPHRSDRTRERVGGFGVAHFLEVAQHDDLAIANRKGENRPADTLNPLGPSQIAERVRLPCGLLEHSVFGERLERAIPIQTLARAVPRDPAQPRGHTRSTVLILRGVLHHDHEDILGNVVGSAWRAGHVQGKPVDLALPAAEEERERLRITLGRPREQTFVCVSLVGRKPTLVARWL
jgi:hypothetical protein